MTSPGVTRKRLGEILIEQGVLTREKLEAALEAQKRESGLLGQILIRLGMVREEDVVIALATQFGYPYIALASFAINPEAVKAVPVDLAVLYTFMPIDKMHNILTLVMCDPSNEAAMGHIQSVTGCRIQAFVGTVSEIAEAIRKYYKLSTLERKPEEEKVKMVFKKTADAKSREEKTGHD